MSASKSKKNDIGKKIVPNPKYKHVKSSIDTGASMNKYMEKIEDIRKNYKYRPNETFKRMKITTLVQLMIQVHRIQAQELRSSIPATPMSAGDSTLRLEDEEISEITGNGRGEGELFLNSPAPSLAVTEGDYGQTTPHGTSRSTLLSVAGGIGELDLNQPPPAPQNKFTPYDFSPFLILDCRNEDCFQQCRILTAFNFPKSLLSRSVNWATKELLAYRNVPGKIIVVYDEDERIAQDVVGTLMDRGYDNVFMLSGGLKVAYSKFPDCLITGTIPSSILDKDNNKGTKKNNNFKTIQAPVPRKTFTDDEIDSIEIYLDRALEDSSSGTSRLSKMTTSSRSSKASRATSNISNQSNSRPAFRPP